MSLMKRGVESKANRLLTPVSGSPKAKNFTLTMGAGRVGKTG